MLIIKLNHKETREILAFISVDAGKIVIYRGDMREMRA